MTFDAEEDEATGLVTCTLACASCSGTTFQIPSSAPRTGTVRCGACGVTAAMDPTIQDALDA